MALKNPSDMSDKELSDHAYLIIVPNEFLADILLELIHRFKKKCKEETKKD